MGTAQEPFEFLIAPTPSEAVVSKEQPWYHKWWVWTLVGAVAVGGGAGAYFATKSEPFNPPAVSIQTP